MRHFVLRAAVLIGMYIVAGGVGTSRVSAVPAGDDGPTIIKDSVQVTAFTLNKYQGKFEVWSWVPQIQFRVNGPVSSGSQLWVECKTPSGPWVKFDCKTEETQKGHWRGTEGGGAAVPDSNGITYTGLVDFAIHLRNELASTDMVLFSGKIKVAKAHSNESGPKVVEHFVYYVDQDWNLPIGYVYMTPDAVSVWKLPSLNVSFWARGDATGFQPHLFYQGKEVGKIFFETNEMGAASFKADVLIQPTHYVDSSLPEKAEWSRIVCTFPNIKQWDKTGNPPQPLAGQKGSRHILKDNPGEYEVKVLWKNKMARSIKFTILPDGKVEDAISTTNKLGAHHAIVPVQIIGDQDGTWDHGAWKADAFYGNPLTGFTALP